MKNLSLVIALATLMAVCVITQSLEAEYWVITDEAGMPTVTDKQPADLVAGFRGPFKYLRRGGKGHGNWNRVEGTVLYYRAMHHGQAGR